MSAEDTRREQAIAAEQKEDWPWGVWTKEALDRLWAEYGETLPWSDAEPEMAQHNQQREEGREQ